MSRFDRVAASSRFLFLIAVACIALLTAVTLGYGVMLTAELVVRPLREGVSSISAKTFLVDVIELIDLFLVATTLYVIAIGLYELFMDTDVPGMPWLAVKSLDDLKAKVLVMVIVVLGVYFLGQAVAWTGDRDVLALGLAVALVIAALTLFLKVSGGSGLAGLKGQEGLPKLAGPAVGNGAARYDGPAAAAGEGSTAH